MPRDKRRFRSLCDLKGGYITEAYAKWNYPHVFINPAIKYIAKGLRKQVD